MNNKLEIFLMHIVAMIIVINIIGLSKNHTSIGSIVLYFYGMFMYRILHTNKEL